jgi:hypothetical protein
MSQKMDRIKPREEKAKLRITNVSVVRAENKANKAETNANRENTQNERLRVQETNGQGEITVRVVNGNIDVAGY